MKTFVYSLLMAIVFLVAPSTWSELVVIRTINGTFVTPKEDILKGPPGVLKSAFSKPNLNNSLAEDGSLFVNVDEKSMRHALGLIRHLNFDQHKKRSSLLLTQDLQTLFPDLVEGKKKKKKVKVWECAAYCDFKRDKAVKFMSSTHASVSTCWQELVTACGRLGSRTYLVTQQVGTQRDYRHALASMGSSCVETSFKIERPRRSVTNDVH